MSKPVTAALAVLLAAAGFALGHWTATRPARPATAASTPAGAEAARLAIAERVRAPSSLENLVDLAQLLEQLGPDAIPAIPPTILHPGETLDAPRALILLQYWIDRDPKAAATWIAKYAPIGYRTLSLDLAVERIAEKDPKFAISFVGRSGGADTHLLKPFVRGWVHSGVPGVEDWIRNLGYGFKRQKAFGAYWRAKIEKEGAAGAIASFESLPDTEDGLREEAFLRLTSELTYADPKSGVAWYEKHREGPESKGMMMAVVDAWVAVDGPAAMRWLSQQPESPERDAAVTDGVRWWGVADVEAMKRWGREMGIEQLQAAWFQPGLSIFARLYGADDPLDGIHWAERITDEATRNNTLVQIARQWRGTDPAAADAWISQSPLPEQDRERARTVRAQIGPRPEPELD
jgi:hypothetical protein